MAMSMEARKKISEARKRYWKRVHEGKEENKENSGHRNAPEYIEHRGYLYKRHARVIGRNQ